MACSPRQLPDTLSSRYQLIRALSRGASGSVDLVLDTATGREVAIKSLALDGKYDPEIITRELLNQQQCVGHPNIIQLQEVFLMDSHLCIVMELASGGDLVDRLGSMARSGAEGMPEDTVRWLFQQLLVAVDYCHCLKIVNRDIKLDNMMVDGNWPRPVLKLCDFGFSKQACADACMMTICGTPEYMAPEVLMQEGYIGSRVDAWSCGVSLYVLLTGTFPFRSQEDEGVNEVVAQQRLMQRIVHGTVPHLPHVSPACRDLISELLNPDPSRRMTIKDALQHPWVVEDMPEGLVTLNDRMYLADTASPAGSAPSSSALPGFLGGGSAVLCTQSPSELAKVVWQGALGHTSPASAHASIGAETWLGDAEMDLKREACHVSFVI